MPESFKQKWQESSLDPRRSESFLSEVRQEYKFRTAKIIRFATYADTKQSL